MSSASSTVATIESKSRLCARSAPNDWRAIEAGGASQSFAIVAHTEQFAFVVPFKPSEPWSLQAFMQRSRLKLCPAQVCGASNQNGAASGLAPFIRYAHTVDNVMRVAFRNCAVVVSRNRTTASIAYTRDSNALDRNKRCLNTHDLSPVGRSVATTNYPRHT